MSVKTAHTMTDHLHTVAWIALGVTLGVLLFAFRPIAHALPEYTTRTGEPCAACHVNPAGGGPRTTRGSLWIAAGRPDQVSPLPGSAAPASPATTDDRAIYEKFACGGCHGAAGEGGVASAINKSEYLADQLTAIIRNGRGTMMAYPAGVMSDAELAAIIRFVHTIGRGEVKAQPKIEPLTIRPARVVCGAGRAITSTLPACRGN